MNSTSWTTTSALEDPKLFLQDYFEVMGWRRDKENSSRPKLTANEEATWNMIFEVADDIVRRSPFTEALNFLREGLTFCESDSDLAVFAAGPLEDFVVYRVKSKEETKELQVALRQDPTLARPFKEGMVWGIESLPEHVREMLADYLPK